MTLENSEDYPCSAWAKVLAGYCRHESRANLCPDLAARQGQFTGSLARGLLSDRYHHGIPEDSRAGKSFYRFLKGSEVTPNILARVGALNDLAKKPGRSWAQMALAWVLRDCRITSLMIGASKVEQIEQNVTALQNSGFSEKELRIDLALGGEARM